MGVAGLWEVLRPAGQVRSLTELAVEDGFNANRSHRGFRIGIDASIWFFHAAYGKEGENPELRTLFFRCCRLLQSPLLPLFVFDGPNRPAIKRGKRVGGNVHWLTQGMKNIIEAFGFEWRVAPGEAEAELAYLSRVGIIDAVLSDDVDNFLFGATMVIRNPSNTLSGNRANPVKNAQGKDDGNHVVTYTADAILSDPSVALSREGTILIGLLSGGDYIPAGLPGCGQKFATGLARAGFGDSLVKAVRELKGVRLDAFLDEWRQDIRNELRTNKRGLLPSKKPSLALSLPDDFPSLPVLMSYADPITSENTLPSGKHKMSSPVWRNDPDPKRIASLCELYFEWGVKDVIVQRFRTVLWPGIVCRAVRRAVLDDEGKTRHRGVNSARYLDNEEEGDSVGGPSSPTRRISSALSGLTLSSPSKKPSHTGLSASDALESFKLSSLVSLTSSTSPGSSRSASLCSPTSQAPGSVPLLLEVVSQRTHVSTDDTLEYRVLIDPTTLVERAEDGVKGIRPPLVGGLFGTDPEDEDPATLDQESGSDDGIDRLETAAVAAAKSGTKRRKARREVPTTPLRLWVPACMIRAAAPALAETFEEKVRVREEKKAKRGTKGKGGRAGVATLRKTRVKDVGEEEDDESVPGPSTSKTAAGSKSKAKIVRAGGGGGGRRKPKHASEAQNDAYEFIDLSAGESPCSSNEDDDDESATGKGKGKAGQKPTTEASTKTNATKGRGTTTNTMKEFYNTTKRTTVKATKGKPSGSRPLAGKPPTAASRRIYKEEEEDSEGADIPAPLPKSSRPLDLLRAKSKASTAPLHPTSGSNPGSNSTAISTHDREEPAPSSSSPPHRPSGSKHDAFSRTTRIVPKPRKKPLFVDVSDTDSEIEVSGAREPPSEKTAAVAADNGIDGTTSVSIGVGRTLSSAQEKAPVRVVDGVIDLTRGGNATRSKSTCTKLAPTNLTPPTRAVSAPLDTNTSTKPIPGANTSEIDAARSTQSLSKLARILLPPSALESEEEEESGDELPTFHRGSKTTSSIARPAPRPFPMHLALGSPMSHSPSSPKGGRCDDDDEVEIVDVFTSPREPSPPRSPTLSPSPARPLASEGPPRSIKPVYSGGFPASPTKSRADAEPQKMTKENRRASSDSDTPASHSERNGVLKSPRKSAAHSSPRHTLDSPRRVSSPTPFIPSNPTCCANDAVVMTSDVVSDNHDPQQAGSGSTHIPGDLVGRKLSDTSAISISSGSEDEGNPDLGVEDHQNGHQASGVDDQDLAEFTDQDVDGWADTAMILSAPPSPALPPSRPLPDNDPVSQAPVVQPGRASKFKPAPMVASKDLRAPSTVHQASSRRTATRVKSAIDDEDMVVPDLVRRAPLLVARAKRNKGKDDDVIDLTSD